MSDILLEDYTDSESGGFTVTRHCGPMRKDDKDRRIVTIYYGPGDDKVSIPMDTAVRIAFAILQDKVK